jgi:menaquinone-specific isochorismate synthase
MSLSLLLQADIHYRINAPNIIFAWMQYVDTAHSNITPRLYWRSKEGDLEIGAYGATDIYQSDLYPEHLESFLAPLLPSSDPYSFPLLGGVSFPPLYSPSSHRGFWTKVPKVLFFRPTVLLIREGDEAVHLFATSSSYPLPLDTQVPLRSPSLLPVISESPSFIHQEKRFKSLQKSLDSFFVDDYTTKIVLAESFHVATKIPCSPYDLVTTLQNQYSYGAPFCLSFENHISFVGYSPEQLLKVSENTLTLDALAGTTWPSDISMITTPIHGTRLKEHSLVADYIRSTLDNFGLDNYKETLPIPLSVGAFSHLSSQFSLPAPSLATIPSLIAALHPTPAVCGVPQQTALAALAAMNQFERGWYAGFIGVLHPLYINLSVGIRSAFINNCDNYIFGGAGCVPGSNLDLEWEEIVRKASAALSHFGMRYIKDI